MFFTVIFIYIITLGSFDDFKETKNLVLHLVIGIFAFFVVKPIYKKQYKVILLIAATIQQIIYCAHVQ